MALVELGDEVKCKITGFRGIATAIAKCLTGCDRVEIRAPVDKNKKMGDFFWFDFDAVEIIKKRKVITKEVSQVTQKKPGGPIVKSNLR